MDYHNIEKIMMRCAQNLSYETFNINTILKKTTIDWIYVTVKEEDGIGNKKVCLKLSQVVFFSLFLHVSIVKFWKTRIWYDSCKTK